MLEGFGTLAVERSGDRLASSSTRRSGGKCGFIGSATRGAERKSVVPRLGCTPSIMCRRRVSVPLLETRVGLALDVCGSALLAQQGTRFNRSGCRRLDVEPHLLTMQVASVLPIGIAPPPVGSAPPMGSRRPRWDRRGPSAAHRIGAAMGLAPRPIGSAQPMGLPQPIGSAQPMGSRRRALDRRRRPQDRRCRWDRRRRWDRAAHHWIGAAVRTRWAV